MASEIVIASEAIQAIYDAGQIVVYVGKQLKQCVEKRRRQILCQQRNQYVSNLLKPVQPSEKKTWDMLVDGINDQQIQSFHSHGNREDTEAVTAAWVSSIKVLNERDREFANTTGLPLSFWQALLDRWSINDIHYVTNSLEKLQDCFNLSYIRKQGATQYFKKDSDDFTQTFFGRKCRCWGNLTSTALEEERFARKDAINIKWSKKNLDTCTAILALVEAGDESYCLLRSDKKTVTCIDASNYLKKHTIVDLPSLMEDISKIRPKSDDVWTLLMKTALLIADELRCSYCNPITSIRMALFLLSEASFLVFNPLAEQQSFSTLFDRILEAVRNDIAVCSRFMSVVKRHYGNGDYFCDFADKKAYNEIVNWSGSCEDTAAKDKLKKVQISDYIQCDTILSQLNVISPWKPYMCSNLVIKGVKAVRDAHLKATRKRLKETVDTRNMVALALLVFWQNLDPHGEAHYGLLNAKTNSKTCFTIGKRLSAIHVPFSERICIYNHDLNDYEIDDFTQQPFFSDECCFLEPIFVLWRLYSSNFPQDKVDSLVQKLEEDYTNIFRLNNVTFSLIKEANIKLKMSDIRNECAELQGTDSFRAHVFREVLHRIIKAGAQKAAGSSGFDAVFDAVSAWGAFGATSLEVELDTKTNLLGVHAELYEPEYDDEEFYPPENETQGATKKTAFVEIGKDAYLVIYGTSDNYHAVLRQETKILVFHQPCKLGNIMV